MGSPDVLSSGGHDFPSLAAGPTCPRGPGAAGPGLQGSSAGLRKWEWREPVGGRGQGALGAETGLSQSRRGEEEQAWPPRRRAGGGVREST